MLIKMLSLITRCFSGICDLDGGCRGDDVETLSPNVLESQQNSSWKNEETEEGLCVKCHQPGAIYKLKFRQAECCTCFLAYTNHKFRASIGTSKVLPKNAKVLLLFDGHAESVVLLHMLHSAQSLNTHKRLHCSFVVLIIDDYYLLNKETKNPTHYLNYLLELQDLLKSYRSVKYYIIPFAEITEANPGMYCLQSQLELYFNRNASKELQFIDYIAKIKSLTLQQDFVECHKRKMFNVAAQHLQCKFIFKAESSTQLASKLLTSIALGRGASCALDVHLTDDRYDDKIKLIRPLRDLSEIEIRLYLQACSLKCLSVLENLDNFNEPANSIQSLTKHFVNDLQNNFPSTVPTINSTGSRINFNKDASKTLLNSSELDVSGCYCICCNSLLDCKKSNTLEAVEFSRLVSDNIMTAAKLLDLKMQLKEILERDGESRLCYACRNIFRDLNEDTKLNLMK